MHRSLFSYLILFTFLLLQVASAPSQPIPSYGLLRNFSETVSSSNNLSIPIVPFQPPALWHLAPLQYSCSIPILSIYAALFLWVNEIWESNLDWLDPSNVYRQCDPESYTCISLTVLVAINPVEAAWLAIAVWEANSQRLGRRAEYGVWSISAYQVTYLQNGRERKLGELEFTTRGLMNTKKALGAQWVGAANSSVNATGATLSAHAWTGRMWSWLNFYPSIPSGLNANALGTIFVHSMMSLCWSQQHTETPRDRTWQGPIFRGARMTIEFYETEVWDVSVTYAMVATGLRGLFRRITHGYMGEIGGTVGLENVVGQVQVFAKVEVKVVRQDGLSGGDREGNGGVGVETY